MEEPVVITGGAGFLGSHLAKAFLARGLKTIIIDNLFRGKREYVWPQTIFYNIDIADEQNISLINHIFEKHRPRIVIHYAAINGTKYFYEIPDFVFVKNSEATRIITELAVKHGVELLVYASSSEVYGEPMQIPIPEEHPIILDLNVERDSYAASKAYGEFYIKYRTRNTRTRYLILRIFNTYGPYMDTSEYGQVIPEFIRKVLLENHFTIIGDGKQTRSFLYVEDHVEYAIKLVETKRYDEVYNIGSEEEITILDLARMIHEITGKDFNPIFLSPRPHDRVKRRPNTTKIRRVTRYTPRTNLREGLIKTICWYATQWRKQLEICKSN